MYVSNIHLNNFRNYRSFDLELSDGVTVFYGKNGLGKTNILEAVFLSVIGKSFRNCKDTDLITYGENEYSTEIKVSDDITENITVKYEKNKEKYVKVNGFYLRKLGHLMGNLLSVIFSPEDLQLITEGPSERRKFMDIAISQLTPSYYFDLLQFNKILAQKNSLLKKIKYQNAKEDRVFLEVLNDQLSDVGSKIICNRYEFINEISLLASKSNEKISGKEVLNIQYDSGSFGDEYIYEINLKDIKEVKERLFTIMQSKVEKEIEREISYIGPHRDDIIFKLNQNDIKRFGSQGQKRTAVLSLKMAEVEILRQKSGRKPILLLDDVLSELDIQRQRALIESLRDIQTLITCTHIDKTLEKYSGYHAIPLEKLVEKNSLK